MIDNISAEAMAALHQRLEPRLLPLMHKALGRSFGGDAAVPRRYLRLCNEQLTRAVAANWCTALNVILDQTKDSLNGIFLTPDRLAKPNGNTDGLEALVTQYGVECSSVEAVLRSVHEELKGDEQWDLPGGMRIKKRATEFQVWRE